MNEPDSSQLNPFQAPQQDSTLPGLPSDTEFLISDSCVVCGHELKLPAVCILTGVSKDLVRKERVLTWTPQLLAKLRLLLVCMVVATSGIQAIILNRLIGRRPQFAIDPSAIYLIAIAYALTAGVFASAYLFRHKVHASWYVQSQVINTARRNRRIYWGIAGIGVVAVLASIRFNSGPIILIFLFVSVLLLARRKTLIPRPIIRGRYNELYIVIGLSDKFLAKVQDIIDKHHPE